MNPVHFESGLLNDFATKWSIKNTSDTTDLLYSIDIKAKKTENERDTLKLDVMKYKAKCKALEKENEKLKNELNKFENPN